MINRKQIALYVVLIVLGIFLAKVNYSSLYAKLLDLVTFKNSSVATELTEEEIFVSTIKTFSDYLGKDYFEYIQTSDDLFMTMNNMVKIAVFKESLSPEVKANFRTLAKDIEFAIVGNSETGVILTSEHIRSVQSIIKQFLDEHYPS